MSTAVSHGRARCLCTLNGDRVAILLGFYGNPVASEKLTFYGNPVASENLTFYGNPVASEKLTFYGNPVASEKLTFLPWGVLRALFVVFGLDPVFGLSRVRLRLLLNLLAIEAATLAFFRLLLNLLATEAATLAFFRLLLIL